MRPWNPNTKSTGLPGIEPRLLWQTVPVGVHWASAHWATEAGSVRHLFTSALHLQPGIRCRGTTGCSKCCDNMSQHWPLSQTAGRFSSTCSVCLATCQLRLMDGKIHRHDPRDNPCPGSNTPPLLFFVVLTFNIVLVFFLLFFCVWNLACNVLLKY